WMTYGETYQAGKRTFSDLERMPPIFAAMIRELSTTSFLGFLERLTGLSGLMPDPYLHGAGLHCSGPGGVMAPHIDTHLHRRLGIHKRLNLMVYLNPGWREEFGGCLELYDRRDLRAARRVVVPAWGTCAIFLADARSVHGFPQPVEGERLRRALAMYYY